MRLKRPIMHNWKRPHIVRIVATLLALFSGTPTFAADPPKSSKDPFESVNRVTYKFNDALDRSFLRPVAEGYRAHVPELIRNGLSNFITNLEYPTVIVNDALQGKLRLAGQDFTRLLVNSVVGVGGFGDPATKFGLPIHNEDFGQTLGHWGVGPGPYIMIPLLGASDLRDAPSWIIDAHTAGEHYATDRPLRYGLGGLSVFEIRVQALAASAAIDAAYDPYTLVRDAYLARRNYLVHDGNVPADDAGYELTDDGTIE